MLILGIDDAGRGPVIGPMVLAGCLIDDKIEPELKKLGVKDSKMLTHKRREILVGKIRESAQAFEVVIINPDEIDGGAEPKFNLNELEALAAAKIINSINKGETKIKVIVDCPSTGILKWQNFLKTKIENLSNLEISCEHKADKNHLAVSAASILAKSQREKEMDVLREKYGAEIGSGYTSDPLTQHFLEKHAKKYEEHGIFRKTWITWQKISFSMNQKKLDEF